jgi:hypothetical protein
MVTNEASSTFGKLARVWDYLLAGRPLVALAVVLFTTTGHAMNLRELSVSQGWIAAVFYILQTSYLFGIALIILACPALGQRFSCRDLARTGLVLAAAGAFLNGWAMWAPMSIFVIGRVVAGVGAGLVIYFAPRLLDRRWLMFEIWAAILCPVAGPGLIAAATMSHEVSDWQWAYFYEGAAAVFALFLLLSMVQTPESPPPPPRGSLAYLPSLVVAAAAVGYCLHWGQLQGWLESLDIVIAATVSLAALIVSLWLAWPQLDFLALKENGIRLILFFFAGACQFFLTFTINTYGGGIVNFSSWQRVWMIWPMPIGIAVSLALSQVPWRGGRPLGLPSAAFGLLLLAGGLYHSHQQTMDWPFWHILDTRDLNWFMAPTHWELAPGRFLMGLGIGLLMISVEQLASHDAQREATVQPFLPVVQFLGGGLATGVFVNFLLIGHPVHYSYSADRDYIQADEFAQRRSDLRDDFARQGEADPERATEVLLYRFINYETENLVFATIYATFLVASLLLAGVCLALWMWLRLRKWRELPSPTS